MKTTSSGGCHCGAVRFEADVDLRGGTSRCNCSICSKLRLWKVSASPEGFRLTRGAGAMTEYRFGACSVRHQFCATCGVKLFGHVEIDGEPIIVISVAALEASDETLAEAEITYQDGRHDAFDRPPAVTSYL